MEYQDVAISNDIYGSDILLAYELAKGLTKPIEPSESPNPLPDDLRRAHDELVAKRPLNLILRSPSPASPSLQVGDMVLVYRKHSHDKRGRWTAPGVDLSIDRSAASITGASSGRKDVTVAFENVRPAISEEQLALTVLESIDLI